MSQQLASLASELQSVFKAEYGGDAGFKQSEELLLLHMELADLRKEVERHRAEIRRLEQDLCWSFFRKKRPDFFPVKAPKPVIDPVDDGSWIATGREG